MHKNLTLSATLATCAILAIAASAQQPAPDANGPGTLPPGGPGQFQGPGQQMQHGGRGSIQNPMHMRVPGQFQGHLQGGGPSGLPMEDDFFPPEMLMRAQQAIGLTDDQRDAIRKEMQESVGKFTEFQWQQSAENEKLAALSKADAADEEKILAQLDALLKVENEMKRLQARTMIRVRNVLTPEQRTKLREMRRFESFSGPMMGMPGSTMGPQPQHFMWDRSNRGSAPQDNQEPRGFRGRGDGFGERRPRPDEAPRDNQEAQPK